MNTDIASLADKTVLLLVGYNRIDLIKKRLNELYQNMPIEVFVSIDGPISTEKSNNYERFLSEYFESGRNQSLKYRILEKNLGLAKHITETVDMLFHEYEYVIVVEDDVLMSPIFVESIINGFVMMEALPNIAGVGGFSAFGNRCSLTQRNKWRQTKYFSAWGWGTSREYWELYNLQIPEDFEKKLEVSERWQSLSEYEKKLWISRFTKVQLDKPHTWDFQMQYMYFSNSLNMLLPTKRLSDNEGFSNAATNTIGQRPRWMLAPFVSKKIPKFRLTKFERIFELVDGYTIGGNDKFLQDVKIYLRLLLKIVKK